MSAAQEKSNRAIVARFEEAVSSGDWEIISKTIDELVGPDALIRSPIPTDATGMSSALTRARSARLADSRAEVADFRDRLQRPFGRL